MYQGRIDCSFVVSSVRYAKFHKQDYIYFQQEMMRIRNLLVITFLDSRSCVAPQLCEENEESIES